MLIADLTLSLDISISSYIYIYNFVKIIIIIIIIGIDLSSFTRFTVQNNYLGLYTGPKCSPLKSSSGKQCLNSRWVKTEQSEA